MKPEDEFAERQLNEYIYGPVHTSEHEVSKQMEKLLSESAKQATPSTNEDNIDHQSIQQYFDRFSSYWSEGPESLREIIEEKVKRSIEEGKEETSAFSKAVEQVIRESYKDGWRIKESGGEVTFLNVGKPGFRGSVDHPAETMTGSF